MFRLKSTFEAGGAAHQASTESHIPTLETQLLQFQFDSEFLSDGVMKNGAFFALNFFRVRVI